MAQPHRALRRLAHKRERLGQKTLVGLASDGALAKAVGRSAQFGIRQRGEAVFERVDLVDYTAILPKTLAVAEREQLGYGHGKKPPGENMGRHFVRKRRRPLPGFPDEGASAHPKPYATACD